jgi:hypothetical protein
MCLGGPFREAAKIQLSLCTPPLDALGDPLSELLIRPNPFLSRFIRS